VLVVETDSSELHLATSSADTTPRMLIRAVVAESSKVTEAEHRRLQIVH
jgi:hypothetical protein